MKFKNNNNSLFCLNRKELEASIRTQVAAEEKAHHVVEQLVLENSICEKYLLEIGNYITPSHYSDIVEERAIAKVCGYPLCSNELMQLPKQKYKISVKTNRVFDITERKNYCSTFCYKASKYFESQIPTSPVWTRIGESPKKFTLLQATDLSFKPNPGEILVGSGKLERHDPRDEDETKENASDIGSNRKITGDENTSETIRNAHYEDQKSDIANHSTVLPTKDTIDNDAKVSSKLHELAISKSKPRKDYTISEEEHKAKEGTDLSNQLTFTSHTDENEKTPFDKNEKESVQKVQRMKDILKKDKSGRNAKEIFLNTIKDTLIQWFTDSTYRYLNTSSGNIKTLEDYSDKQNETHNFKDKTLRFHKTNKKSSDADDGDDNNQTEKNSKLNPENMTITEKNVNAKEGFPCVVPPIDSKSQLTIRRQIVLQKLTQVLPEVIDMFPHNKSELITHFTALVRTFSLESRNTMFKPLQWKVLATALVLLLEKHVFLKGDVSSHNREKMLVHLGLTKEDMNSIMDSISMHIQDTNSSEVPSQDTETRQEDSGLYSRMEDLD